MQQTRCAISDEKFDLEFDKELSTWFNIEAVKLKKALAEKYGVDEGAIVKVGSIDTQDL